MEVEVLLRLPLYFALLLMSGFFSGSETALFSIGQVQLMHLREKRHPRAELLARLLSQPRRLIATIFIGNEFVNIGASALMASLTNHYLQREGPLAVALVSTAISVTLILMLGEITPKNLAAKIPQRWAVVAARPIWLLALLMTPIRWLIERTADGVVRLVGGGTESAVPQQVGEEEFRTMVDVVRQEGELDQREYRLIHNIFEFGERRVTDVMTPVGQLFALNERLSYPQILDQVRKERFSRVPVYRGNRDRIVGTLHAKDLLAMAHGLGGRPPPLKQLLRPVSYVAKTTMCEQLFRDFRQRRIHMALVVDEYGRLAGLVTMEDLLEEMFGEIRDEKELPAPDADGSGSRPGAVPPDPPDRGPASVRGSTTPRSSERE